MFLRRRNVIVGTSTQTGSGWGSGNVSVTPPASISIALNDSSFSGRRSGTSGATLTLTRTNFTDDVSLSVSGLPTGTTASFSPATLTGATLTSVVTLTHAADASLVTDDAFTITATGTGVSNATVNATVTVEDALPAGAFTPNEPAGLTTLADIEFDSSFNNATVTGPTSYTYKGITFTKYATDKLQVEAGMGESGQYALRMKHYAGTNATYAGQATPPADFANPIRHLYMAWSMFLPSDFQTEGSGHKLVYPETRINGATSSAKPMLNIQPIGLTTSGQYRFDFRQNKLTTGGDTNLGLNINNKVFSVNQWYRMEYELKIETLNQPQSAADGIIRLWASDWNGSGWDTPVLLAEHLNVVIGGGLGTTQKGLSRPYFDVYRGGSGTPTLIADARLYFSRMYWSRD